MVRANHPNYLEIFTAKPGDEFYNWHPSEDPNAKEWDRIFGNRQGIQPRLFYNPCDVRDTILVPGHERMNMAGWDDVQYTCPRIKGVPKFITLLKGELTAARPEISVLGMTSPNRLEIAAPLRSLPNFEIIIPRRGVFEVQRTIKMKKFNDPEYDIGKLVPVEKGYFRALPKLVQRRYDMWRIKQKEYTKSRAYVQRKKQLEREAEAMVEEQEEGDQEHITQTEFIAYLRNKGYSGSQNEIQSLVSQLQGRRRRRY